MPVELSKPKSFQAVVEPDGKTRALVPIPFDPASVWGDKPRYHVNGTVDGHAVRGPLRSTGDGWYALVLGAAWLRDCPVRVGARVKVVLAAEGPQRERLDEDIATALEAEPAAAEFFDSLASFYRKGYLTWVGSTKRRPDVRAERIAAMVAALKAGKKERPR